MGPTVVPQNIAFEVSVVSLGDIKEEWHAKAMKARPYVSATMTYSKKYEAKYAVDGNPQTEWV